MRLTHRPNGAASATRPLADQIERLHRASIVIAPRIKVYEIAPQFIADKTERILDFDYCVLRLNAAPLQR